MTTPKGVSGTISKETHSGKSRCWTNETDVSRMPNINITYKRWYFSMSVLQCIDVPCNLSFLPLSVFRGSGCKFRGGQEEAKMDTTDRRMITDCLLLVYLHIDIVNGGVFIRSKGFVPFKTYCADEITVYGCLMGWAYEIRTLWVQKGRIVIVYKRQAFCTFALCILLPLQWDRTFLSRILSLYNEIHNLAWVLKNA